MNYLISHSQNIILSKRREEKKEKASMLHIALTKNENRLEAYPMNKNLLAGRFCGVNCSPPSD
jgi:hypothetical protein